MNSAKAGFWIGVLAVVSSIACIASLVFTSVHASSNSTNVQAQSAQPAALAVAAETYEGIVTDTHCQAKHSAKAGLSAGDCTRACVHGGEHFALVDGDKAYTLEGESDALKRVAGERVKIAGTLNGNTITVASVTDTSKAE
jgi:hypothetical protein